MGKKHSAVADMGATSSVGMLNDPFEETNEPSHKIFTMPVGNTARATNKAKLILDLREEAREVHKLPDLKHTHSSQYQR